MTADNFHRDNHYVPRSYLKRWTASDSKLWSYRVLVSHPRVPAWRRTSTRGIAYLEHLYTTIAASGESDRIERLLDTDFEAPAEEAIARVVSEQRLKPTDWKKLARFFAAQDVRTPARMIEHMQRWSASLGGTIESSFRKSLARLEAQAEQGFAALPGYESPVDCPPLRTSFHKDPSGSGGWVVGEAVIGRGLWIWSLEHHLAYTIRTLYQHRWTILRPPEGLAWLTSDDPVLKVNISSANEYTFGGGWGSIGTSLFLPLGPQHLLFTEVGKTVPPRGTRMDLPRATFVRKLIAEHAHRYVFSSTLDPFVAEVRPRIVDAEALARETAGWRCMHSEHTAAERRLARSVPLPLAERLGDS